jgi:hypothetical protein
MRQSGVHSVFSGQEWTAAMVLHGGVREPGEGGRTLAPAHHAGLVERRREWRTVLIPPAASAVRRTWLFVAWLGDWPAFGDAKEGRNRHPSR